MVDSPFSRLTDLMMEIVEQQKLPIPRPLFKARAARRGLGVPTLGRSVAARMTESLLVPRLGESTPFHALPALTPPASDAPSFLRSSLACRSL